jgi:hypothetical protein
MAMSLLSKPSSLAVLSLCCALASCGGGGRPADPPADLAIEPGDGQVTLSWTATAGVDYWAAFKEGATAASSDPASQWAKLPLGLQDAGKPNLVSPAVIATSAQCAPTARLGPLVNGLLYTFAMNSRIDGGPGGADVTVSATPRLGGNHWISQTVDASATPTLRAVTYGVYNNTAAKLITPYYLGVGDDKALYSGVLQTTNSGHDISLAWTPLTSLSAASGTAFNTTVFASLQSRFIIAGGISGTGPVAYTSQDLVTWSANTFNTVSSHAINALATDGSTVVAVGDGGTIWTASWSGGVANWNLKSSNTTQNLYGIARSSTGRWVAVGAGGTLLTSTDASTWTNVSSGTSADLRSVTASTLTHDFDVCNPPTVTTATYHYVAVGDQGTVIAGSAVSNAAPSNWALANRPGSATPNLRGVVSANQQLYYVNQVIQPARQLLALGADGTVWTSPDGSTWSAPTQTNAATGTFTGLTYLQGLYVALGNAGTVFYSH